MGASTQLAAGFGGAGGVGAGLVADSPDPVEEPVPAAGEAAVDDDDDDESDDAGGVVEDVVPRLSFL
jgi:hypothetical protein